MLVCLYKTFIKPEEDGSSVSCVCADQSAAQADVSNSFSIISSTSSGRYLWYFSGFLVKEMLAHLEQTGIRNF